MSKFSDNLIRLGFASYAGYLRSARWTAFKATYAQSNRPKTCAVCDSKSIQLHHHDYTRLGKEVPTDVTPLCRGHHIAVHELLKLLSKSVFFTSAAIACIRESIGLPRLKEGSEFFRNAILATPEQIEEAKRRAMKRAERMRRLAVKPDMNGSREASDKFVKQILRPPRSHKPTPSRPYPSEAVF